VQWQQLPWPITAIGLLHGRGSVTVWLIWDLYMESSEELAIHDPPIEVPLKGTKFDSEKIRVDLLDPLALEGLAKVLTFGAKKYGDDNWRGGLVYSRVIGALLRHLFAIMRGEDNDPESGYPHIDHVGCCWMFLSTFMKSRKDLDDRFYKNETPQ
jgi:hypothetical protein